ncbi:MAG: hypothetical protein ACTSRI_06545 [Promethearchaeota archaeon]
MPIKLKEEKDLDLTIGEIKEKYIGIPSNFLAVQLMFKGKVLSNEITLREIGFRWEDDVLIEMATQAGGG